MARNTLEIEPGMSFEDSRSGDTYTTVFASEYIVVLQYTASDPPTHVLHPRDQFEDGVAASRWDPVDSTVTTEEQLLDAKTGTTDTEIDATAVSGIGAKTASNLADNGYDTAEAVTDASDDELGRIGGMGAVTVERLQTHAQRQL